MKVQRTRQTPIAIIASGVWQLVARANEARIYLGFFPGAGSPTIYASLSTGASATNGVLCMSNTGGLTYKEWWRDVHGLLVRSEWYWRSAVAPGTEAGVVLEVIEEDTGQRKSDGGIILGTAEQMVASSKTLQSDRAASLRCAIETSLGVWTNATRKNIGRVV